MNRTAERFHGQRGFTLAEVLVASAVFIVIMVAALAMYDRSNRVFKSSVEASDLQQNIRVAYDRMIADVRMAGFDYMRAGFVTAQQQNAPWQMNQNYTAGTIVTPVTANGHTYRATNTGLSGGTEPSWPTSNGGTVVDTSTNSITWKENGGQIYQQPDEQIEYAGTSAITIRANLDYSMNETLDPETLVPDGDHGRETNLESAQFPIVTTGNDEIVTYALVSTTASANTGQIQFYADVNNGGTPSRTAYPGGNAERQITITGVDLTNNNPPYTLHRYTLDAAGAPVDTALASNIRSLTFLYYTDPAATTPPVDSAGAAIQDIGGAGQYNPATPASLSDWHRVARGTIRAIRVRLVGMNATSDTNYQDTDTANGMLSTMSTTLTSGTPVPTGTLLTDTATQNYRKMVLDTVVVPRNLGVKGMTNTFISPPVAPTISSVCVGYCGIAVVNWAPNTSDPNASYLVEWDLASNPTPSFPNAVNAGVANSWAVDLTQSDLTQTYVFKVVAYNQGGSRDSTNTMNGAIHNATTPNAPASVAATANPSSVTLRWTAPNGNFNGTPTCTSSSGPPPAPANASFIREVQGYEIQRDTQSDFSSGNPPVNLYTNTASDAPVSDGYGNFSWTDNNVQNCQTYYYRVKAYEWCYASDSDNTSSRNQAVSAYSNSANVTLPSATPQAPASFQLDSSNSSCNANTNSCTIAMNWARVTQSTANQPISVTQYQVKREQYEGATNTLLGTTYATVTSSATTVPYSDTALEHDISNNLKYVYKYYVQAIQPNGCPSSAYAGPVTYPAPCAFSGSVLFETNASRGSGTLADPWVMSDNDTIGVRPPTGTTFSVTEMDVYYGSTLIRQSETPSSPASFTWQATGLTQGAYFTAVFTVTNTSGCTQQLIAYLQEEVTTGCTLTAGTSNVLNDNLTPQSGTAASGNPNNQTIKMTLTNSALVAVTITSIDITWTPGSSWNFKDVYFPGNHTYALGNTTTSPLTLTVNPLPSGFTSSDVTIAQSGSAVFYLDFGRQSGNTGGNISNSSVFPSNGGSICIHYTRSDVQNFTFACRVVPSAGTNNPQSCN